MRKDRLIRVSRKTTLEELLAYHSRGDYVTADDLWRMSWEGPLKWADTGFEGRYERLAEAINDIIGMFG